MVPRILIDTALVPGGGELRLYRRGEEFSIMIGGNELMNSRLSGSEEALATLVSDRLDTRTSPRILIGGLGMGFTLRASLREFDSTAKITVAEIVPAVIGWARGPMAALYEESMADPRVIIKETDVGSLISPANLSWDAIILDVDNGPDGLSRVGNDRLYTAAGLNAARAALNPGGILAIWSAAPDARFVRRLVDAGFAVEEVAVKARGDRGARHVIWLANRADT